MQLFNLKADSLESSKFRAWWLHEDRKRGYSSRLAGGAWHYQWEWPEDEEIVNAYLMPLRMFLQKQDIISVHRLPELYGVLDVAQELSKKLTFARERWLQFLETNSTLVSGERRYTNEQALHLVLYGDRARAIV